MNPESVYPFARVWNRGNPPHVGWWNASVYQDKNMWRWWDGEHWSEGCACTFDAETAFVGPQRKYRGYQNILWCDYWPENARVARINPDASKIKHKPNVVTWHSVEKGNAIGQWWPTKAMAIYPDSIAILRIEINRSDSNNPVLVSATLESP